MIRSRDLPRRGHPLGWLIGLAATLLLMLPAVAAAAATAGSPDLTFGDDGRVPLSLPSGLYVAGLAVQPDGRTVVVGTSDNDFVVWRYDPDGSPDTSFDGDGLLRLASAAGENARGVAIQPDGRIVVVGEVQAQRDFGDALAYRLNGDGTLDQGFGPGGRVVLPATNQQSANAVAVQADGRIVLGGFDNGRSAVWRLNGDGSPDASFDGDGVKPLASGRTTEYITAVALAPDGRIVVAGYGWASSSTDSDGVVYRLGPDGALDASFDGDGAWATASGADQELHAVAVRADGRIVAVGEAATGTGTSAAVHQLTVGGAPDADFAGDGRLELAVGDDARGLGLALQADGRAVVAGVSTTRGTGDRMLVARVTADGRPDERFGAGGVALLETANGEEARDAAVLPDGRITVLATVSNRYRGAVHRLLGDPGRLRVERRGDGAGTVQSAPAAIDCGATCAAEVDAGRSLALVATPSAGSTFAGWSGGGCSGTGACRLVAGGTTDVVAHFVRRATAPGPSPDRTAPVLNGLSLSPARFRVARSTGAARPRARRGTRIRWRLSEPAAVVLRVTQARPGRRSGTRCVAPRRGLRTRCTRTVVVGRLRSVAAKAGTTTIVFSGRLGGRALRPGRYRAEAMATDRAGNRSRSTTRTFEVLR